MRRVIIMDEDGRVDKMATAKQRAKEILTTVGSKTKKALASGWSFVKENREDLVVLVPLGVAAISGLKKATQKTTADSERYRIDHTYYDPRTGRHWELRRKMTNYERMELEERQAAGELTGRILESMRLLK